MAINNPLNGYKQPGLQGYTSFSIENYRYYCDRINQFYKKFNIHEDEKYLKYLQLSSKESRENFLNDIIISKRNHKIDLLLI